MKDEHKSASMGRLCCTMSLLRTLALICLVISYRVCLGHVSMRILSDVTQCEADQCKESVSYGIAYLTCCSLNAALELVKHYNDSNSTISVWGPSHPQKKEEPQEVWLPQEGTRRKEWLHVV